MPFIIERQPLDWLQGKRVGAFSGIAVPESFEKFVRDSGGRIAFTRRFLDHYRFTSTPISPPSGLTQWLFQGPPAESKFLAVMTPNLDTVAWGSWGLDRVPIHSII